jgi:hypothetical protein
MTAARTNPKYRGESLMDAWSKSELDKIAEADETRSSDCREE